jgi:opacity protein-like surface antigen
MHVRIFILLAATALVLASPAAPVLADGLVDEVKLGVLAHDVPDLWSGFRAEPNSADVNLEALLAPKVSFAGGTLQPAIGASINTVGATSMAYLDARWQYETSFGVFLGLGVGAAVHDGQLQLDDWDRKALGSRVLFHFPIEIGYRLDDHNSLSAYFEHTSTGFTAFPNEGMDRLGLRYGYRFDPAPPRDEPAPAAYSDGYDWTGIYAGANIGGAWGSFANSWPVTDRYFAAGTAIDTDGTGFFGGGQIGWQQQWGGWVPAIEVQFIEYSDLSGSASGAASISDQANWSLLLTPRLGYALNRWLVYGKAGYALTEVSTTESAPGSTTSVDSKRGGWVVGGGLEYALTDWLILGADYQHISVGSISNTGAASGAPGFGNVKLQSEIDTASARLSVKFGPAAAN